MNVSSPITSKQRISLPIEGMHCASCVGRVEAVLSKVPGVDRVAVNLATERADIDVTQPVDPQELVQAVRKIGFEVPEGTIELAVRDMSCASCVARVERALKAVPGVSDATVNLATERATVQGVARADALVAAVQAIGFGAEVLGAESVQDKDKSIAKQDAELTSLKHDLFLALALTLPVFIIEMGSHLIPGV